MNIKKAEEQIENAMRAYFSKNEFGEYKIPIARQRSWSRSPRSSVWA